MTPLETILVLAPILGALLMIPIVTVAAIIQHIRRPR